MERHGVGYHSISNHDHERKKEVLKTIPTSKKKSPSKEPSYRRILWNKMRQSHCNNHSDENED